MRHQKHVGAAPTKRQIRSESEGKRRPARMDSREALWASFVAKYGTPVEKPCPTN